MRIGLDASTVPELGRSGDDATVGKPEKAMNPEAPTATGVAHRSKWSNAVKRLKTQLDTVPEIRQDRVDVLRQAIKDGSYKISPHAVATAMLAEGCDTVFQSRRPSGSGGGQPPTRRDRRRRHNCFVQPDLLTVDSRGAVAAAKAARRAAAALLLPRKAASAQAGRMPNKPA
jgi:flagellar biosynthesis anti-sigma factor FlgM